MRALDEFKKRLDQGETDFQETYLLSENLDGQHISGIDLRSHLFKRPS